MIRNVIGWCAAIPPNSALTFEVGKMYPIQIQSSWFRKKIVVHARFGKYFDELLAESRHEFPNREEFNKTWQVIKED